MITKELIEFLMNVGDDLDDMDFTELFGDKEGIEAYNVFEVDFSRDVVRFLFGLTEPNKTRFVNYINKSFTEDSGVR